MSYALAVWRGASAEPPGATFEDVARSLFAIESLKPGVNPRFVELAHRMATYASLPGRDVEEGDATWDGDPVAAAQSHTGAVWVIGIPDAGRVAAAHFVVDEAIAAGLTVLDDQLGMAFLPDGRILPDDKASLWRGLARELAAPDPARMRKADVRRMMLTFLENGVAGRGFSRDKASKSVSGADVTFRRKTEAGEQTVEMAILGSIPDLDCRIYCRQRNEAVEAIWEAVHGVNRYNAFTMTVNVGAFIGEFSNGTPFRTVADIKDIFTRLETQALPLLDHTRTLGGLNDVLNGHLAVPVEPSHPDPHPNWPKSLKEHFWSGSDRPLIVAWLAKDPQFDEFADHYRRVDSKSPKVSAAEIDVLVSRLKTDFADR